MTWHAAGRDGAADRAASVPVRGGAVFRRGSHHRRAAAACVGLAVGRRGDRGRRRFDGRNAAARPLGRRRPAGARRAAAQHAQGRGPAHRFRPRHRRVRDRPGCRSRVRPRRVPDPARAPGGRRRGRRLRVAIRVEPSTPSALLLAFGGQPLPHSAVERLHRPQPHRHGDLLQGIPARRDPVDRDRGGPVRVRARDHGEDRPAPAAHLRGRHLLQRQDLRRGQEDRLARRRASRDLHREVLDPQPVGRSSGTTAGSAQIRIDPTANEAPHRSSTEARCVAFNPSTATIRSQSPMSPIPVTSHTGSV